MSDPSRLSRRQFLVGTSAAAGLAMLAACSNDEDNDTLGTGGGTGTTGAQTTTGDDTKVAEVAAGLEVLAVNAYRSALDAATAGRLGPVPPAGAELVKTALAHHEAHRDAWNAVLRNAGRPEVTTPNDRLAQNVAAEMSRVTDFAGAARLVLGIEEMAAATYLQAVPDLRSQEVAHQAASIQAVDAKHVAILLFVLGQYPVPDSFAKTDRAVQA